MKSPDVGVSCPPTTQLPAASFLGAVHDTGR
jgi:hypothetical protein